MAAMNASVSPALDFPGRDKLVAVVDAAVSHGDEHAITAALRNSMCAMIRNGEVRLPDEVFEPLDDHYARRELYRSPEHGYSVGAMNWAPGQEIGRASCRERVCQDVEISVVAVTM